MALVLSFFPYGYSTCGGIANSIVWHCALAFPAGAPLQAADDGPPDCGIKKQTQSTFPSSTEPLHTNNSVSEPMRGLDVLPATPALPAVSALGVGVGIQKGLLLLVRTYSVPVPDRNRVCQSFSCEFFMSSRLPLLGERHRYCQIVSSQHIHGNSANHLAAREIGTLPRGSLSLHALPQGNNLSGN